MWTNLQIHVITVLVPQHIKCKPYLGLLHLLSLSWPKFEFLENIPYREWPNMSLYFSIVLNDTFFLISIVLNGTKCPPPPSHPKKEWPLQMLGYRTTQAHKKQYLYDSIVLSLSLSLSLSLISSKVLKLT